MSLNVYQPLAVRNEIIEVSNSSDPGPEDIKHFFMLNLDEHGIFPAHKY